MNQKRNLIIIAVVALVVLAIVTWWFLNRGAGLRLPQMPGVSAPAPAPAPEMPQLPQAPLPEVPAGNNPTETNNQ